LYWRYSRHETCDNGLEEQGNRAKDARKIAADATAEGKQSQEQGADGEKEGNEDEGEHEPGHIVELVRS